MKKIRLLLLPFLTFAMSLASCNKAGGGNQNVEVSAVKLDQTSITLDVGSSKQLTATVEPDNATDKTVTWSTSDNTVASVSNGLVRGAKKGTAVITATAGDKNATCNVTVNEVVIAKALQAIKVTPPNKTTYYVGDELDLTGIKVIAVYTDRSEETLSSDKYTVSGFDSSAPVSNQSVTVSYTYESKTKTGNFNVTILEKPAPTVASIAVTQEPTKKEYEIGDDLDTNGLVVTATYSDGSTKVVSGYTLSGFSSRVAGTVTVTVTFEGKSASFTVTIKEAPTIVTITGIEVTTKPTKVTYEIGEALDTTGMVVKAVKSNGTSEEVTGWKVDGFSSETAGEKTVGVTWKDAANNEYITTFKVTVLAAPVLESIKVDATNAKTTYNYNEELDKTGVVVTAKYDRGDDKSISVADCEFSGYDKATAGEQTITVTYEGKKDTYKVTVNEKAPELQSLVLDTTNVKVTYEIGDNADFSGLVVKAHYDKGDDVTLTSDQYEISGFDSATSGTKTITVSYGGKTETFDITVNEPVTPPAPAKTLSSIAVTTNPTKTEYTVGDELDKTGMVITATYSDESTETIDNSLVTTDFDSSVAANEKTVTVTYEGKTASFTVKIVEAPVVQKEYVLQYKRGAADWAEVDMEPKSETEYKLKEEISLEVDDLVRIHMTDGDDRDFTDVKDGCKDENKFISGDDDYIQIKMAGDYQFYVEKDGSSSSIWVERHNIITGLVASYGNGHEMAFVGDTIDGEKVDVHYTYDDGSDGANIADEAIFYVLLETAPETFTPYKVSDQTVIAESMVGTMRVYASLETVIDDVDPVNDPYFDVSIVKAKYFVVGVGDNWAIGQDGFELTVDPLDKNHYTIDAIDVSAGNDIKIVEENTEVYYGNNDANYHFDNAGTYNIDFYVKADNHIHIVATLAGSLTLSQNDATITMGEDPVVITARNIAGTLEVNGAVGSGAVANAELSGSTITITAVGAGSTTFTVSDDENSEVISVTVYNQPDMYIASSEHAWETGLAECRLEKDPLDSNHYQITDYLAANGEKMKVVNISTNKWQGNGEGDGEDFVFAESAYFTIDFYVNADNNIHIVATKTHEILTLSSNEEALVVGGHVDVVATKHNGEVTALSGYDTNVVDVEVNEATITITAKAQGSTLVRIGDEYTQTQIITVNVVASHTVYFTLDVETEATNAVSIIYDINRSINDDWIDKDGAWHEMAHETSTKRYTYTLNDVPNGANVRFMFATWTQDKQDTFLKGFDDWKPAAVTVNSDLYVHSDGEFPEADVSEKRANTFTTTNSTKVLSSIAVDTTNAQLVFEKGDELVTTGLVVTATYSDSTNAQIALNNCEFTGYNPTTVGPQTITVSYKENGVTKTANYSVNVKLSLSSIAVTTNPTKMAYEIGDSFDATGMVVTATYTDGSTKAITPTSVSSPDMSSAGSKTVTITYEEAGITKSTTLVVTVAVTLSSIEITTEPTKTTYKVGDSFDPAGIVVTAHYSDSSTSNVSANVEYSGFDSSAAVASQTITVTYQGKTDTFTIKVITLSSIAVTTNPTKTAYYIGEEFDSTGLVITATYSDSSTASVVGYLLSAPNMSTSGTKTITVTYTECGVEKTTTFDINVGYKVYVKGSFNDWTEANSYLMVKVDENTYRLVGVELTEGSKFRIYVKSTDIWYSCATTWSECGFTLDGDKNIVVSASGTYTITYYVNGSEGNYVTIGKTGELTSLFVSSNTVSVYEGDDSDVTAYFNSATYTIEAVSGNPNIATVSINNSTITITGVAHGEVSITVNMKNGDLVVDTKVIAVTVNELVPIQYTCTWTVDWIWNDDAVVMAWVYGGSYGSGAWVAVTKVSATSISFTIPQGTGAEGVTLVRLPKGTTPATADWNNVYSEAQTAHFVNEVVSYSISW